MRSRAGPFGQTHKFICDTARRTNCRSSGNFFVGAAARGSSGPGPADVPWVRYRAPSMAVSCATSSSRSRVTATGSKPRVGETSESGTRSTT